MLLFFHVTSLFRAFSAWVGNTSPAITLYIFWPINMLLCLCFHTHLHELLSHFFSASLAFGMSLDVLISLSILSSLKWLFLFQKINKFRLTSTVFLFVCDSLWSIFCFKIVNSFHLFEGQIRRNLLPRRYATPTSVLSLY